MRCFSAGAHVFSYVRLWCRMCCLWKKSKNQGGSSANLVKQSAGWAQTIVYSICCSAQCCVRWTWPNHCSCLGWISYAAWLSLCNSVLWARPCWLAGRRFVSLRLSGRAHFETQREHCQQKFILRRPCKTIRNHQPRLCLHPSLTWSLPSFQAEPGTYSLGRTGAFFKQVARCSLYKVYKDKAFSQELWLLACS